MLHIALPTVLATGLLAARIVAGLDAQQSLADFRYWEDSEMAIGDFLDGEFPVAFDELPGTSNGNGIHAAGSSFRAATAQLRPWRFWRTIALPARSAPSLLVARFDDAGRPLLLSAWFRLVGGVAPWALFWICFVLFVPVFAWVVAELTDAGAWAASWVLAFLVGTSCFVGDCLRLAYSPIGYYIVTIFAVAAYAVYAAMARTVTLRGLLGRSLAAGAVLALCVVGRSGSMLAAGGFFVALAIALVRRSRAGAPSSRAVIAGAALGACALLLLPTAAAKQLVNRRVRSTFAAHGRPAPPPQSHPVWFGIWGGLGDFDRSKGHAWRDEAISDACVRAGGTALPNSSQYDFRNEPLLRQLVLHDIGSDPLWFAGIVGKRLVATVLQTKLWPWIPLDHRSLSPASHPNEGAIDSYYSLTRRIDFFGVGRFFGEVPISFLLVPTLLLLLARARPRPFARWLRVPPGALLVLAAVAAATLPCPVLITTAAALETQAFALAYLFGAAFVVQALLQARAAQA